MTPQQQLILDAISEGLDPDEAAHAAGVSIHVLRNWKELANGSPSYRDGSRPASATIRNATEFYEALPRAAASGKRKLLQQLHHNATTLNPKTGWYDTQAIDKILSKSAFRKDWYERRAEDLAPRYVDAVYREVEALSDEELEAIIAQQPGQPALPLEHDTSGGLAGAGGAA